MDLSDYFIIQKYRYGWFLGSLVDSGAIFLDREKLHNFGLIENEEEEDYFMYRSRALIVPKAREGRADQDSNWRK